MNAVRSRHILTRHRIPVSKRALGFIKGKGGPICRDEGEQKEQMVGGLRDEKSDLGWDVKGKFG